MDLEHPQKCTVRGNQLAYYREGKGKTVLLVHGITSYAFIWREIMQALSQRYDVIALDLLGCGASDTPLDIDYSLNIHADLICEFAAQLEIAKLHFVGHDIGGGIGQIIAVRYPELLHDLTLINTVAYDFWPVQPIIAMRTPIIRQLAMATLDLGTFKLIIQRAVYHKERVDDDLMSCFSKPLRTQAGRKAFLHFAKSLNNEHLMGIRDQLRQLNMPVLIIRGDADVYLSQEISKKLQREIPGSRLVRIPTAGHFIQFDEPALVASTIRDFYRG